MPDTYDSERQIPSQSPLYHAIHSGRYDRQQAISEYQNKFACKLVVMKDVIFNHSVVRFEDLIYDASPETDLHVILASQGGDGETAVRLVRAAQARCKELTIIVPDQAKSAATLMALGAHHILMSATSDLGPIDSQFPRGDELVSAKDIIAAVDDAAQKVQDAPGYISDLRLAPGRCERPNGAASALIACAKSRPTGRSPKKQPRPLR